MKRTLSMFIALLLCLFVFVGCDKDLSQKGDSQLVDTFDLSSFKQIGDDELLRIYIYKESDDVVKPAITLFEDNKFSFTFSAVSSYLGVGRYTIDDDFLILNTDDGVYTYTFKIEGEDMDRLIFLAEKSSEFIHFGDFEDGAVFD